MAKQLRLGLQRPRPLSFDAFVRGPSNAHAVDGVQAWPTWIGGTLALVGPVAAGKSHLAAAWAERAGAVVLDRLDPDIAAAPGRPVLVEDVDRGVPAEALFHLINLAGRDGGSLLLTARTPPASWPAALPDLRSRLNALPVAAIDPPDDAVLEGLLRRFFDERSMTPSDDIYPYLLRRMGRSAPEARDLVQRLNEAGEAVTRVLARQVLGGDDENLDLFG